MKNLNTILVLILAIVTLAECGGSNHHHMSHRGGSHNAVSSGDIEPCRDRSDIVNCVRDFMQDNAICEVVRHPPTGPLYFEDTTNLYSPTLNATIRVSSFEIQNLEDTYIVAFYISRETNNIVLGLNMTGVCMSSDSVTFLVDQVGAEPKEFRGSARGYYNAVVTGAFPMRRKLTARFLQRNDVTEFVPDDHAGFLVSPEIATSRDPDMMRVNRWMNYVMPLVIKELWLTGGVNFFTAYLQNFLCDFRVPLIL